MINIVKGAQVTVRNLIIDGQGDDGQENSDNTKHGLNVYGNETTVTVENVTIKNGNGYGIVINGGQATINNLTTSDNGWGGINVDSKSGSASLIIENANISELNSVRIENTSDSTDKNDNPEVRIQEGIFQYITTGVEIEEADLTISGGKFATGEYEEAVDISDYLASGLIWSSNGAVVKKPSSSGGGGGSVTAYAITVEDSENGQVEANRTSASRGSSVTLTVTPDEGYELSSLTVTDADGNEIEVTENDGIYRFTMPSSKVTVTAEFTESSENPGTPEELGTTGLPFTDVVSTDWYYDAVAYAYENDLMNGISSTQFNPNGTTTRGMIATILYRLEGEPEAPACDFTDVAAGQYYTDAVAWAAENHLVNGYGDGTFGPNDNITREQMSALLYRYAEFKGYDLTARGDLSGYTDASQISDYAVTAMQWATAEGLVNGMGDGTLAPRGNSTRAQIATILMRFLENIA